MAFKTLLKMWTMCRSWMLGMRLMRRCRFDLTWCWVRGSPQALTERWRVWRRRSHWLCWVAWKCRWMPASSCAANHSPAHLPHLGLIWNGLVGPCTASSTSRTFQTPISLPNHTNDYKVNNKIIHWIARLLKNSKILMEFLIYTWRWTLCRPEIKMHQTKSKRILAPTDQCHTKTFRWQTGHS